MAGYWLKLYTEILEDPKYYRLSESAKLGMYELMMVAKKCGQEGDLPSQEDICFYTRRSEDWWAPVLDELKSISFVIANGNGDKIRKFEERQRAVDAAERQQNYRKSLQHQEYSSNESVTKKQKTSDEDVTKLSRNVTEIKSTEIESEKEAEEDVDVPAAFAPGDVDDIKSGWVKQSEISNFEQLSGLTAPISQVNSVSRLLTQFELVSGLKMPILQDKVVKKWYEFLIRMDGDGVTEEIMRRACQELTEKHYRIAGPWSIEKACGMILAERKRETVPRERQRDSAGAYADFVNH